jgi:hypothetical protein
MLVFRGLALIFYLIQTLAVAGEPSWIGQLQDGSEIAIDPTTNKATRSWQGEESQLWDGVHRLNNGAVIIVRDGVVVKDMAVLNAMRHQEEQNLEAACMNLVKKVCGPRDECHDYPGCDPARQLLVMENEERLASWEGGSQEISRQCMEALENDKFFSLCTKSETDTPKTACEDLKERVCGRRNQCGESEACNLANQLLVMEREDQYVQATSGKGYASEQCLDVARDEKFFRTCKK